MAGQSFLSSAEIAELWQLMDDGNATVQAFGRPAAVVDFLSIDEVTGEPVVVGPDVALVSITFGLREGQATSFVAVTQVFADGDIVLWADGFIPEVGNLFVWGGHPITVTKVFPEEQGTVTAEVSMQQVT